MHIYSEPYEPKPIIGAAITTIRGKSTPMDLVRVETRSQVCILENLLNKIKNHFYDFQSKFNCSSAHSLYNLFN